MTFHAPHSKSRLVALLLRRVLLSRSALFAMGAAVSTTVVLAGRAPEAGIDHSASLVAETFGHSLISRHLGLPDGKVQNPANETIFSRTVLPETLGAPVHKDSAIRDILYSGGDSPPAAHIVPDFAKLREIDDDLAADFGFVKSSIRSEASKPRNVEIASLAPPNPDWSPLNSSFEARLPDLGPTPNSPLNRDIGAIDSAPEINGLEAGPVTVTLVARPAETIEQMLARADLSNSDRRATLVALRADKISDSLSEGDVIDIAFLSADDNQLLAIRLRQLGQPPIELRWDGDTDRLWDDVDRLPSEVQPLVAKAVPDAETLSVTGRRDDTVLIEGKISSSLYSSAAKAGLTAGETKTLSNIFRYSVDFERDLRKGDHFEALFEKKSDGAYGNILYAKLTNRGSEIALYRGVDDVTGEVGYFDATGKTNKRSLMRTPVAGAQVSSHFGMRRHPVLGYSKMHRGTDFRAPRGTPVFAAGDGIVDSIGRNGSFGEYIRIRHNSTYETAYAHLSGYAPGLNFGDRVRQGDVIGYVGTTGRSTGPHLHFEILKNSSQINPLEIADFGPVRGLSGAALSGFMVRVSRIEIALTLMRNSNRLATAE